MTRSISHDMNRVNMTNVTTPTHSVLETLRMDKKAVGARIRSARESAGLSRKQLMLACGWTGEPSRIGNYELGINAVSIADLSLIANAVGVSWSHLAGEDAPDSDTEEFVTVPAPTPPDEGDDVVVKFYPRVKASAGHGFANGDQPPPLGIKFRRESLKRRGINPETAMVITALGPSMENTLHDGDSIMFDRSQTNVVDGEIYVIEIDDETMVKRLLRRPGGRVVIKSDNEEFPPYEVDMSDPGFKILGQMVWSARWH